MWTSAKFDDPAGWTLAIVEPLKIDRTAVASKVSSRQQLSIKDGVLSAESSGSGSSDYVLPAATADTLGGVKVGDGLTISDGVLSVKNTGSSGGSGTLSAPVSNYELLKSKQFYNNVFQTAVNYDALMGLKKELKK